MISDKQKDKAALMLRLALAFVFLYAAVRSFMNPQDWVGYIPDWVTNFGFTRERFLTANSLFEIIISLLLLTNFKTKWLALISAAFFAAITAFSGFGLLDVTFRDIGLMFAALALFLLY
jgi:uncharacterized membrane protein YphA (DoxX/SURF4 family)